MTVICQEKLQCPNVENVNQSDDAHLQQNTIYHKWLKNGVCFISMYECHNPSTMPIKKIKNGNKLQSDNRWNV